MAKVVGSIDDRGRPLVRIEAGDESHLLTVDTGFNGDLLVAPVAARALNASEQTRARTVELGDGSTTNVRQGRATIRWLDESRDVRLLIAETWSPRAEEPVGLIGTALLSPHLLLADFGARIVKIETQ